MTAPLKLKILLYNIELLEIAYIFTRVNHKKAAVATIIFLSTICADCMIAMLLLQKDINCSSKCLIP